MIERLVVDQGHVQLEAIREEGGWFIRQRDHTNLFDLYEVPQYGGEERFIDSYSDIIQAITKGRSFT